jgi:hypothetical protein
MHICICIYILQSTYIYIYIYIYKYPTQACLREKEKTQRCVYTLTIPLVHPHYTLRKNTDSHLHTKFNTSRWEFSI